MHSTTFNFSDRLRAMFAYQFGNQLNQAQIDRVRWHLFPEIRVPQVQLSLFDETPDVEVLILSRPGEPALGVGECAAGPTAAAVANALFKAMGVRARDLPLTPERIARAME